MITYEQLSDLDRLWAEFCRVDRAFKHQRRSKVVNYALVKEREKAADEFARFVFTELRQVQP